MATLAYNQHSTVKRFAQVGLIAIGVVYCLLGILSVMAAIHIGGQSTQSANKEGIINWLENLSGGKMLLLLLIIGLLCYAAWRYMQAFANTDHEQKNAKGWGHRARYLFSGLVYTSFAISGIRLLMQKPSSSGNTNQKIVAELLQQPFGKWLVGILALLIVGAGIYQIFYALSEKYKRHVDHLHQQVANSKLYLRAGKIGHIARGIVWLTIGWLMIQAALEARSEKAGDTAEAFQFLMQMPWGNYILMLVGGGLVCYGIFCFIRSRYESL